MTMIRNVIVVVGYAPRSGERSYKAMNEPRQSKKIL